MSKKNMRAVSVLALQCMDSPVYLFVVFNYAMPARSSLQEIAAHIHFPEQGNARKAHLLARIEEKRAELDVLLSQLQSRRAALESILPELRSGLRADK
jgi:MerR, DNA binding